MGIPDYNLEELEIKIWNDALELCKDLGIKVTIVVLPPERDFDYKISEWICKWFIVLVVIMLIK